jgi:hypothetical protein
MRLPCVEKRGLSGNGEGFVDGIRSIREYRSGNEASPKRREIAQKGGGGWRGHVTATNTAGPSRGGLRRTELYAVNERFDCDRNVIRRAQNLDEHRGLRTHTERPFWRVKPRIACALKRFGVRQCGWRASLSKRA